MFPAFNDKALLYDLKKLSIKGQRAFGALCCDRLFPNYLVFAGEEQWGKPEVLVEALNLAWLDIGGIHVSLDKIRQLIDECEFAAPHSDDFENLRVTSAQDACFSICSLLDHLIKPEPEMIVRIATYAIDSVDLFVQETENMRPDDPKLEYMILNHPLMQKELGRQANDLAEIQKASVADDTNSSALVALRRTDEKGNLTNA